MTEYTPGQLYLATVRDEMRVRVMRTSHSHFGWVSEMPVQGRHEHFDEHLKNVHPLVTVDPRVGGSGIGIEWWLRDSARHLRHAHQNTRARVLESFADQIEKQLPKPRIPEPNIYGVVTAGHAQKNGKRSNFVRVIDRGDGRRWMDETHEADLSTWDELIDPQQFRVGMEPSK